MEGLVQDRWGSARRLRRALPWLGLVALTWAVFVATGPGQQVAAVGMGASALLRGPLEAASSLVLGLVTARALVGAGALTAVVGLARGCRREALLAPAVLAATVLSAELLKPVLPRPQHGIYPPDNSLPSGHMAVAAGACLALLLVLPRGRGPALACAGLMTGVGLALLSGQAHALPDVIASVFLARAWYAALAPAAPPSLAAGLRAPAPLWGLTLVVLGVTCVSVLANRSLPGPLVLTGELAALLAACLSVVPGLSRSDPVGLEEGGD